jgi:hypothetical protein
MNTPHKCVVFGFIPHKVKAVVTGMVIVPVGLPAIVEETHPYRVKTIVNNMDVLPEYLPVASAAVREGSTQVEPADTAQAAGTEEGHTAPVKKVIELSDSFADHILNFEDKDKKPDMNDKIDAPAAPTQPKVASEEKIDTSFRPDQSKRHKRKVKLSGAWSVDVHLRHV